MNNKSKTIKRYDIVAEDYAKRYDDDTSNHIYLDQFLSYLKQGDFILDLGCGTGRLTAYYAKKGFKVIGTDLSQAMLSIARKKHPTLNFIKQDMNNIDFPQNHFEAVSAAYSLFHLTKKEVALVFQKIKKILKNNGILFLILQEGSGEGEYQDILLPDQKIFLNLYTETEIRKLLEKNNFSVLSVARKHVEPGKFPFDKLIVIAKLDKEKNS